MSDSGYICLQCRTKKNSGEPYYSVLDTDGLYLACCSMKCAEQKKQQVIQKAKSLLTLIENQKIDEDIW